MNAPMGNRNHDRAGRGMLDWFGPIFVRLIDRIDRGLDAGSIDVTLPGGERRILGGRTEGPLAVVEIRSWRAMLRLVMSGSSGWYEGWAKGEWASPDPVQVFAIFSLNRAGLASGSRAWGLTRLAKRAGHWLRRNSRSGSRRNIHFHYDLGNDFYREWLDPSMTYSSAIFAAGDSLEQAQQRKLDAILERTGTSPGDRILEIGCGWGSFAETAGRAGRRLHGITLSTEQKAWAEARIAAAGIDGVDFALTDYRDVTGRYDAVASIEMVEAVGREYWSSYLATIARVLKPGGRAAIQYISFDDAIFDGYADNVDFIQRYIFPGGLLIRESEFRAIAARHGLAWSDRHGFGLDYAETLKQWRENFDAAEATGRLPAQFDSRFNALWRYYLMYCEGGFRGGGIDVAQVTLIRE
ncbi:SAM-dependent methyltransferase [Nostoc sp. 3335mG]|nr:SAM-dependent methyltransferase [Nostoc sp. 3335mG]